MLGDIELEHVQKIEVDGDQVLVQHGVPALEGDFFQGLGRRATQISLAGVLTGPEAGEGLNTLRDKVRAAEPVSLVADITTATRVDQVLIEEMGVRELAGKPERFEYAFTLREYIPPPPPEEEPEIETPEPPTEEIDENVGTLIVEVIIEGELDFDFSRVSVTVQGNQQDGTALSRTLTNRTDNIWTEERIPASQGEYTVQAVETNPETRSGSTSAEVRAGERTRVRITLRSGVIIARAFIVHFRFDKSLIEPCQRAVMRQVAQYANDHPEEKLVIVGHTDKVGDATQVEPLYNQSLSERRGRSAFAYLTFGHNSQASLDEWNQLRQRRTPGQRLSINDTWGAYEYQFMLQDLGYYRGNIDGDHGPLTDLAIDAFCCASGLPSRQTMDDPTWETLIRAYLAQDDLQVPLDRFFPNCPGEILKWFGCGEESPLLCWGRPPRATAWRPFRRVEVLFVQAEALPCQVPQPDTFDLPQPGAVANGWCVGPTTPGSPRCCLITYEEPEGGDRSRKWWVQPAEPGRITAQGTIRFEGFPPQSRIEFRYVIIAPDGEFMDGEIASGPSRGEPQERRVSGNTNDDGVFEYTFSYPDKPEGVYTLDIRGDFVVRLASEPSEEATGNVICKRLNDGDPNFNVTVIARPPLVINPTIILASSIVVVKKPHTNPARQRVILRLDYPFCHGDGTFNRSQDIIRFFDAATDGTEIRFDNVDNVFPGARLSAGVELFAEGRTHSTAMNDVQLTLTVTPAPTSPGPPVGPAATATMTAVELTLDICVSRTAPGVAPAPLPQPPATPPPAGTVPNDKWFGGRFVHVQDPSNHHGRALLIIRQVRPAAFAGDLVLRQVAIAANNVTGMDNKVQVFDNERRPAPPATETAYSNPHEFNASTIPATGLRFWVEGRNVSAALRDTGFQLGIKDLENDGDRVRITVVQFTQIQATIRSTPPNTIRAGFPLPLDHVFTSNSFSEDFTVNDPLVLMRNAQPDIQLEVTAAPAGLPILWQTIRNSDDHPSLGGVADLPTITPDATNVSRAELDTNQRGSFYIRVFIDANGNGTYEDREPSIPLKLILADSTVVADNSVGNAGVLSATISPAGVSIRNGAWAALPLTPANLAAAGMAMELIADVTGGGADGRLGLDRVFAGLVNNLRDVDISAQYVDSTVPPPHTHYFDNAYCSNGASASGAFAGRPLFRPGDTAPALFAFPILDTGRGGAGQGGETATMGRSGPHTSVNRPIGQRWTIRCIDSPSRGFPLMHPVNANAILRRIHYRHRFTANFCFWTNITANRGATGDPADRVYSVSQIVQWDVIGDWNVTTAPLALVATTPHQIRVPNRTTLHPIERAQDNNVEVRPPSGIGILPSGVRVLCFDGSRIT
jgi:outer membrane protein OmpA-like peptidoglycan-associated protein